MANVNVRGKITTFQVGETTITAADVRNAAHTGTMQVSNLADFFFIILSYSFSDHSSVLGSPFLYNMIIQGCHELYHAPSRMSTTSYVTSTCVQQVATDLLGPCLQWRMELFIVGGHHALLASFFFI